MLAADYAGGTAYWQWRPQWGGHSNYQFRWRENVNAFHDWNDQNFFLNVSIPVTGGSIRAVREGEYVIIGDGGFNNDDETRDAWFTAFSLEKGHEGDMLWQSSFTPPYAFEWGAGFSSGMALGDVFPEEEVALYNNRVELKYVAYDLRTGAKLWEWDDPSQYGYYGLNYNSYNGKLLASNDYSGRMFAIDLRTGDIVWEYVAGGGGTESPWGSAIWRDEMVADGKIYMTAWEHSASTPLWRGENLRCIDAETGEELWKFTLWGGGSSQLATADGILIGFNWYDGQVYAFGRGPSATTVTAPDVAVPLGTPVMLRGTVTDQTPNGKRNINNDMQFSLEGTPAISDEDMAEWMEYIFMGQAFPMNAKGVTVNLWSIDPNGNFQDLGQTTSDSTGAFGMNWVPPVPGQYQLTASFDGSESSGPSSATTYFYVDEAPSPGASMEPEATTPEATTPDPTTPEATVPGATTPAEAPLITTEIAIVAVVAGACVIGVVSFWALRKRK